MATLLLNHNAYASDAVFKPLKNRQVPEHAAFKAAPYSGISNSRGVLEDQYASSFRFTPDILDSLFAVRSVDVYRYVQSHSTLVSLLLRARAEVYWIFGQGTGVVLKMERDPEEEYGTRLLLAIQTRLSAASALGLLDTVDERWWLSVDPELRALMKIDVEYI
jgi:hypothetical protein